MKLLEIKTNDLEYNIKKIKERANEAKIIAVIKGNGYGLGLKEFANFLVDHGINYLAVSSIEEAVELATMNLDATILCLEATSVKNEIEQLFEKNVVITIGDIESAKILNEIAKRENKKAHVHLKVDTGFSRYGFLYDNKEEILKTITESTSIFVEGIFSHFSYAYSKDKNYTELQYKRFVDIKEFLEKNNINIPMYHICNSSAFLKYYDDMFLNAVRIGSAFLGRISVPNTIGLKKIGILKSNVVEIKEIKKGTAVGYSNSEVVKKDTKIAIVPVGYSDGFHIGVKNDTFKFIDKIRILKNAIQDCFKKDKIYISISGKKYPVIGRVGMNHITVDITNSDIKIDEEVELEIAPVLVSSKIRREYI